MVQYAGVVEWRWDSDYDNAESITWILQTKVATKNQRTHLDA
jgi:hypothetical protein